MWRGLRAVTAAVLRALAALLVRVSRSLEGGRSAPAAEAAVDVELPPPGWPAPGSPPPPPAHWVELVRERAPELLDGHHVNGAAAPARPAGAASVPAPPAPRRRVEHRIVEWSAGPVRAAPEGTEGALAGPVPDVTPEAAMEAAAPPPVAPPPSWEARAPAEPRPPSEPAYWAPEPVPTAPPNAVAERRPPAAAPAAAGPRSGIRVRAVVEELPGPARPPAARQPDRWPVGAERHFDRPAPPAAGEPDPRWPSLPPSLEPAADRPALREWERVRALIAEQRGS